MPTIDRIVARPAQLLTPHEATTRLALPHHALWELAERGLLKPVVAEDEAGYRREDVERLADARATGDHAALTHEEFANALATEVATLRNENAALRQRLTAARLAGVPHGGTRTGTGFATALLSAARPARAALSGAIGRHGAVQIAACALILLLGLALRAYGLTTLPGGIHGDEAIIGLEAGRILREGNIGPYSALALGQPTATMYLTAPFVWLFGHTILSVRLLSALLATITLLALYAIMRRPFGGLAALVGMLLLATMAWHIHFARVAFPVIAWPLCTLVAIGLLTEALRRADWRWWGGAGLMAGLGIYVYNAHLLFIAIVGLIGVGYIAWDTYYARQQPFTKRLLLPGALALGMLVAAGPMIAFALAPGSDYFSHQGSVSIFTQPEWIAQQGTGEEVRFLATRYRQYWDQVCCHPATEGGDGSGVVPLIPLGILLLAVAGAAIGLARYRHPLIPLCLLVTLIMPFGSVITIDGLARRTFPVAPFLALFAALPLVWLLDLARGHWRASGGRAWYAPLAGVAVVVMLLGNTGVNIDNYFNRFAGSYENRWVFASEITDASLFMNALPTGSHVYFFSDRWSFNYETRVFLAPGMVGEDRSTQHGKRTDLDTEETGGPAVFIFLGEYRARLVEAREKYPQGVVTIGGTSEQPTFTAYTVAPNTAVR